MLESLIVVIALLLVVIIKLGMTLMKLSEAVLIQDKYLRVLSNNDSDPEEVQIIKSFHK